MTMMDYCPRPKGYTESLACSQFLVVVFFVSIVKKYFTYRNQYAKIDLLDVMSRYLISYEKLSKHTYLFVSNPSESVKKFESNCRHLEAHTNQHSHWGLVLYITNPNMSRIVRKPDFCLGENKGADQLRGNREADQRLCFRYSDSTIPLLLKSEISSF